MPSYTYHTHMHTIRRANGTGKPDTVTNWELREMICVERDNRDKQVDKELKMIATDMNKYIRMISPDEWAYAKKTDLRDNI